MSSASHPDRSSDIATATAAAAIAADHSISHIKDSDSKSADIDHNIQSVSHVLGSRDAAKKYACPTCGRRFTRKSNLKSHQLIHSNARPFICSHCSLRFRRSQDLRRHEILHTHEKPFKCMKCGKSFSRGDALLRHSRSKAACNRQAMKRKKRNNNNNADDDDNEKKPPIQDMQPSTNSDAANYFAKGSSSTDEELQPPDWIYTMNMSEAEIKTKVYETISLLQAKIKSLQNKVDSLSKKAATTTTN